MNSQTPTPDKILIDADKYVSDLYNERRSRPGDRHAKDKRIATEIAGWLFDLGNIESDLISNNERLRKAIQYNDDTIASTRAVISRLRVELDIATNRDLSEDYTPKQSA